jgi:protein O-mannosyl-transferase
MIAQGSAVTFASKPTHRPILAFLSSSTVLGLVLVLGSLVVYNPAAHDPFANYDDNKYITENPQVTRGLHWSSVRWAFTTTAEANWHPLTWLSHELDWELFHSNPAGHHYVNILFHAINAWLLFVVLWQATGFLWPSWMVAALFALHPINVESVAWVSERKNLLSMFFFLLALAAYRGYTLKPGVRRYLLVVVLFALGLMAKPQVITLPFVLLLLDYWPLERMRSSREPGGSSVGDARMPGLPCSGLLLEKIPLFVLSAASAAITLKAQSAGGAIRSTVQVPVLVRVGNAFVSYARYLQKAFWPSDLSIMYPYLWSWKPRWPLVLSLLVLGLVSVFVAAAHRRYLVVGWLWFLGTLVPMIGLVQVGGQAMADRYAYLPLVGLFVMICWGAAELARDPRCPTALPAVAILIALTALGAAARRQLGYWRDNITLWSHAIAVTGPNFEAQQHLGTALADEDRMAEAEFHFRVALAIDARDPTVRFNLAVDDQVQGRIHPAIEQYNAALRLNPDSELEGRTLNNLAMAYHQAANDVQAEATYKAALGANPNNDRAWLGMGLVEHKLGKFAAASDAFSRSGQIRPTAVCYLLLEKSLRAGGHTVEAVEAREKARELSPDLESPQQIADGLLLQ